MFSNIFNELKEVKYLKNNKIEQISGVFYVNYLKKFEEC